MDDEDESSVSDEPQLDVYAQKYKAYRESLKAKSVVDDELQMWKDAQKLKDRIIDLEEELLKYKSIDKLNCEDCEYRMMWKERANDE